jgi:hypothetical protein
MGSIIATHTNYFTGYYRWEQVNIFEGQISFGAAESSKRRTLNFPDFLATNPTESCWLRRGLIADNAHVYLQMLNLLSIVGVLNLGS